MSKWKKGETNFPINLHYNKRRGCIAIIPKPILEELGNPAQLKFEIKKSGKIVVDVWNDE